MAYREAMECNGKTHMRATSVRCWHHSSLKCWAGCPQLYPEIVPWHMSQLELWPAFKAQWIPMKATQMEPTRLSWISSLSARASSFFTNAWQWNGPMQCHCWNTQKHHKHMIKCDDYQIYECFISRNNRMHDDILTLRYITSIWHTHTYIYIYRYDINTWIYNIYIYSI